MKNIVIVVDMQADFVAVDGALAVPGADELTVPVTAWLRALDPGSTAAVLFTFDTHDADTYPSSAEAREFPIHCVRTTPGWRNVCDVDAVDLRIPVYRLEKGVFAMWEEEGLAVAPLRDTGASVEREQFFAGLRDDGVSTAVVIGVAADYCVKWAVQGLVERGFSVTVPAALTRGIARGIDQVLTEHFAGQPVQSV